MDPTGAYNGHAANPQNENDIQWSEIFARHEAVLCSHMEMLSLVKGQIAPEIAAFQTVSSMVNKTVQAMNQLKIARKQMMNNKSPSTSSASTSSNAPPTTDTEANTRKKRRRVSQKEPVPAEPETTEETRSSKRSRDASSQPPPFEEEADVTPTSLGTEDIAAEVQRRLKIREEQRRKRETPKKDKRKRDSLASNDGTSLSEAPTRPHKKRAKVSNERKRGSDLEDETESSSKKRRKTP